MEEPAFLVPVQRVVGSIQIENDLLRRLAVRVQEQFHKQPLNRRRIVAHFVILARQRAAQLQPVQRRFAGHRRTVGTPRLQLARQDRHRRIMAQMVVVVQVFISQCQAKDALTHQRADRVFDQG